MRKGFFKRYGKLDDTKKNTKQPTTSVPTKTADSSPGIYNLAKNLTNALIQWNRAGRPVVSNQQWNKRLNICRQCKFWEEIGNSQIARCKKCGCSSGKLLLATSKCPLNPPKWDSEPH